MTRRDIPSWAALAILAGTLVVLYAPLLIEERFLFWGLPSLQFYPWRSFAFDEIAAGRMPFLNPHNGAGAPLIANYQSAIFYPPNWLHMILGDAWAMSWLAVLHVFWAGWGMWHFAGQLGILPLGRGISVLSYALAGYMIARLGSFPTANAVAWIPWLLWAVLCVVEKQRLTHVGALALVTGLLLLVGHAQTAWYGLLAAGLMMLWLVFSAVGATATARIRMMVMCASGVILGVGIAAVQLLFTAELLAASQRSGGVDYETLTNLSYAPLRIFNLLMPNFFGSPVDGSYLTPGSGVYFEDAVYIGVIPVIGAVAALVGWLRHRKFLVHWRSLRTVPFWWMLAIVGFVLATGRFGPVYRFLYEVVPTFDNFREPVRWMIWPVLSLSILAGIGAAHWGRSQRVFFWTRLSGAAGAGLVVMALAIDQFIEPAHEAIPVLTRAIIAFGAWLVGAAILTLTQPGEERPILRWQWAVLLVVALDLGWAAQGLNPTVPDSFYRGASITEPQDRLYWFEDYEETVKFDRYFELSDYRLATRNWPQLRTSLLPNINMVDDVPSFNNFDPLVPEYFARYTTLIEDQEAQASALLQAAGVGQTYGAIEPETWIPVSGENPSARSLERHPSAWIAREAIWFDSDSGIEQALLDETWKPDTTVILAGESEDAVEPLEDVIFFETLRDNPTEKQFRVVTEGVGYLVLAQTWYPGWEVSVDGDDAKLYRANLNFMAVEIPDGGAEITFRYVPDMLVPGVLLTFFSICIALGLMAVGLVRESE